MDQIDAEDGVGLEDAGRDELADECRCGGGERDHAASVEEACSWRVVEEEADEDCRSVVGPMRS